MALQAGFSTVKVLILLGAGLTGTFMVNNGRLSDFLSDLSEVISKHLQDGEVAGKVSDKTAELAGQLTKLRQDLMNLAASREVTVINGSGSESGSNLVSLAMPAAVVGAAGYGYFRWKGWSLSDFMYVTKRHMVNAVSEVSKQFDQVSAVLAATRKHLSLRIEDVSKALDDSVAVQAVIKDQVLDIRTDVAKCGGDVQVVQRMVEGLEMKIGEVQLKQDFAKKRILFLCQYLENGRTELLDSGLRTELLQEPKPRMQLPWTSKGETSTASASLLGGLKEISEKLESSTSTSGSSCAIDPTLPRTLRPTLSVNFRSFSTSTR